MPEPSYDDLADTLTSAFRSMRYVETNMNDLLLTVKLLQTCMLIVTVVIAVMVVRKAFYHG